MVEFSSDFSQRYNQFIEPAPKGYTRMNVIDPSWIDERVVYGPLRLEDSIYIPTGRAFFSTPNKGFASFSGKNLDWITQRFSTEMDFDYAAMIESSGPSDKLLYHFGLLYAFGKEVESILGGNVRLSNGTPRFQQTSDGRVLPFELLSAGTLELLPLLNPLSNRVSHAKYPPIPTVPEPRFGTIFVEEPESSVFPKTQYNLVRLFAWLAKEPTLNISLAITTHSPYTLSSFNNLIYAGQLANEKPELKDEITMLVPEHFWIEDGSFRAYCIHDSVLKSILSESGLIDGEYLDSVSDTIGNEFDSLLRLEYDHTEAP
jgi:hypothetical protein